MDLVRYFDDTAARRIQNDRICSRHERRGGPCHITPVALRDVERKGGKGNTRVLFFQLLMAPPGPFFRARRQEYLEGGARKNHGPHVAPVGDQPRWLVEGVLPLAQRPPDRRPGRHARGTSPGGL